MVAVTAVLLLVAGVDLVRDDDPAPTGATATQVAATPTSTPSAVVVGPRKAGKGRGRKNQPPVPAYTPPPAPEPAEPDGVCTDSDVIVEPVMETELAGRPVLVTLGLRTRDAEACTWTISRDSLAYKITDADGDDVWSSAECPAQVPQDEVVVRRDLVGSYRLAWNGRLSSRDCPGTMGHADPGDYGVQAAAIGGEPSEVVPFTLTDPAEVVPQEPVGPPVPETEDRGKKGKKGKGKNKPAATG
ncbi:MAG: hypothetical protein JWN84_1671 [Nocardioides sp.]|nr:hypothetical protein [Nocardioides sp.]